MQSKLMNLKAGGRAWNTAELCLCSLFYRAATSDPGNVFRNSLQAFLGIPPVEILDSHERQHSSGLQTTMKWTSQSKFV